MKNLSIIIIVILIISSCKLSNCNDKNSNKEFDYYIGESFLLFADENVTLKDARTDSTFELWFSGPIMDERVPLEICHLVYPGGEAKVTMQLINELHDTLTIEFEPLGCFYNENFEFISSPRFNSWGISISIRSFLPYSSNEINPILFNEYNAIITTKFEPELS